MSYWHLHSGGTPPGQGLSLEPQWGLASTQPSPLPGDPSAHLQSPDGLPPASAGRQQALVPSRTSQTRSVPQWLAAARLGRIPSAAPAAAEAISTRARRRDIGAAASLRVKSSNGSSMQLPFQLDLRSVVLLVLLVLLLLLSRPLLPAIPFGPE